MESLHTFREIIEAVKDERARTLREAKPLTAMDGDELADLAYYINESEAVLAILARYAREEEEALKEALRHFK